MSVCNPKRWPVGTVWSKASPENSQASCVLIHFMCSQVFDRRPFEGLVWHDEPHQQLKPLYLNKA